MVCDSVSVDRSPVPRAEALELASRARRLIVKVGKDTLRFEAGRNRISREEADRYLVHEDGFLRVPVLVVGDLLCTRNPLTGARGPQLMPTAFNLSNATIFDSLSKVASLDARVLVFGHGEPWTDGTAEAVRRARETGPT